MAIVAADTAWGLEGRLDSRDDGGWQTVSSAPHSGQYNEFRHFDCATPDMRLVVNNDKPWGDTFDVHITYYNHSSQRHVALLDETWSLDSFSSRTHTFTVPADAFRSPDDEPDRPKLVSTDITARVGDLYISACIQQEEPA